MSPLAGGGWVTESRDRLVGAVDGDTDKPAVSTFSPGSHSAGLGAAVTFKKPWSTGLTVWAVSAGGEHQGSNWQKED